MGTRVPVLGYGRSFPDVPTPVFASTGSHRDLLFTPGRRVADPQAQAFALTNGAQPDPAGRRAAAADDDQCPGANPFDGFKISTMDCGNPAAQWAPEEPAALRDEDGASDTDTDLDSGPVRWRNALWGSLCLAATGRMDDLRAQPCADVDAQLWW
ncbi:hypothetical protein D7231_24610 [Streptomyces klenkii]|uniref:Uncharacterized protein n=1 Tax=Streptomyces klenkii TaxID=1420899 RepID=A0A3B0B3X1_9ACTN|nr:hypothetical protein D7231_24610 [Streptomyces klenkii]